MTSALPRPTSLTMPRAEAKRLLKQRVDNAKEIAPDRLKSSAELERAEEKEKKWRRYNVELLSRMFTADDYVHEYTSSLILVRQSGDPYTNPGLATFEFRLNRSVRQQVESLESTIERIDLIPEKAAAGSPDADGPPTTREVFVVHGHDDAALAETARFLEKADFIPIILNEMPSGGRTVIEKLEHYSQVGFAVVLLTPDDVGGKGTGGASNLGPRARQNVIGELFLFIGKLGRSRVCSLKKGDLEFPSDIAGVVYVEMDAAGAWKATLLKELEAAGYVIDGATWRKALS